MYLFMIAMLSAVIGGLVNVLLDREARTDLGSGAVRRFTAGFAKTLAFEVAVLKIGTGLLMI